MPKLGTSERLVNITEVVLIIIRSGAECRTLKNRRFRPRKSLDSVNMFILRLKRSERAFVNDYEVKLTLRVTKEMNERLKKWSYRSGYTRSTLIRSAINHALNIKKIY